MLLIEPGRMCDEDFAKFSTSLGAVLQFMKAAQDKRKLKELVNGNEVFRRLDRKAARVIRDCANVKIDIETNEEVVNVCKGWEDAIEDARLEEREAAQEREKQLCKGWEDAIEDARLEERVAARATIISDVIGIYRELEVPESEIRQRIMMKYALTGQAADTYLLSSGV
ncbi:MAG: hypothetical protein LUH07_05680 [Lachnospiraceae bacterium]|nr:hypothetical protein [Lachnospiraceae bacterium]